ncbi:Zinc metalloprotease [Rhodotorula toruloides ATCC 204091]|uniref:Disintegrin and metalloproteinase domain-containing protein B n=1 Tax=Rhodotorula toruloides TaxID=5286 RepID=A0A0K3CBW8_RHOTO|nr:Zinc metalloprotease [Rhodotorula toruloides ATCC 204091]KAK4336506.1 Zinc metalloprotease [Rhodotorula toruloides]PRQ74150.1 zinc metalloprotease [Rhodotorula toruloides]
MRLWQTPSASLVLATLALTASLAKAASHRPPPLHECALSHPQDLSIHIIPRAQPPASRSPFERRSGESVEGGAGVVRLTAGGNPAWDDRFLLSFLAHDGEPVTLSLRPTADLVPTNGVKSVERWLDDETGEWKEHVTVLTRENVKAYEGWVLDDEADVQKWVKEEQAGLVRGAEAGSGWARIVVLSTPDDEQNLRFQGTYSKGGEMFTIHSTEQYLRTKDDLDPEPPLVTPSRRSRRAFGGADDAVLAPRHPSMVIVRESATLSPVEHISALRKRGLPLPDPATLSSASSCSHDSLPFNVDPAHPVYANSHHPLDTYSNSSSLSSPWLSFLSSPSIQPFTPADHSTPFNSYRYVPSDRHRKRQGDDISGGSGSSSNFINSIGSTTGCPKQNVVLFVGVAADCTYTTAQRSSDAARQQILTDFNSVSALYQRSFNVSLGIVELAVMNSTCPSSSSQVDPSNPWNLPCQSGSTGGTGSSIGVDLNTRLSIFSQWRGDKGAQDGAGLWHLLTTCQTGSEVGVAWLGQLCRTASSSQGGQTTSGTGVTAATRSEWQVIAHEIGHNFGAIHDCASGCSLSGNCCPLSSSTCDANANYIMSPASEKNVSSFSPCSVGNICTTLSSSLNTTCLATPGASNNPSIISLRSCGNGIVESGEECDPGSDTNDPCCDASTCKFRSGAVCNPKNSLCCTTQCQIANNGTVCRPSVDSQCDIAEVCDGSSASCPADSYKKDGTGCGGGLSCASGVCTSRDQQCRNAGASMGLTRACPTSASSSCSIICQDPSSSSSCIILDQSFRDGTACQNGGRCKSGSCNTGSALDTAKGWYRDHLQIAIPVTIVVGLIVLAILWAILRCLCCRGGRAKPAKNQSYSSAYATGPSPMAQNTPYGYYPSSAPQQQGGYYAPPPGPPPARLRR